MSEVHNTTELPSAQSAPAASAPADSPAAPSAAPPAPAPEPVTSAEAPPPAPQAQSNGTAPTEAEPPKAAEPAKKTHKAAIYDNPGTISTKIIDVETPEPGPGEVLVQL
jgi:hypothetical protein